MGLAAGVVESTLRGAAGGWEEARGAIAQSVALRRRAVRLAKENADAHHAARGALSGAAAPKRERDQEMADIRLGAALTAVADLPLAIAGTATDTAELAALAAEHCDPDARPDAAGAAGLAAAAARVAAHLVEVNLITAPDDERVSRARELVSLAGAAADRAAEPPA